VRHYPKRKKNGDRVWWASWTENKVTRRRSTRCSSKPAAELVVARWERERADPVYAAAQSATFGVEAKMFIEACKGAVARGKMAAGTLVMYRQKVGVLTRILGQDLRLAQIDGTTFQSYLDARRAEFREDREREITESNLYKEWVAFRQVLKQAWRAERFGRDPASLKPAHFGPEYEPRSTALTWDQCVALLETLPHERVGPVLFALGYGARRAEERARDDPRDEDGHRPRHASNRRPDDDVDDGRELRPPFPLVAERATSTRSSMQARRHSGGDVERPAKDVRIAARSGRRRPASRREAPSPQDDGDGRQGLRPADR
jgi:hypothetical protein